MKSRTPSDDRDSLIAEANDALTELTHTLDEVIGARNRMAAALARLAHPTPPLRLVDSGDEEHE